MSNKIAYKKLLIVEKQNADTTLKQNGYIPFLSV